jgi:hypothetical protein
LEATAVNKRLSFSLILTAILLAGASLTCPAASQTLPQPDAPTKAEFEAILWGDPVEGLQAGLSIKNRQKHYVEGERVSLSLYIRNVSGHALTVAYDVNFAETPPVVVDKNRKEMPISRVTLGGLPSVLIQTIKAGETLLVWHPGLGIGKKAMDSGPTLEEISSGIYHLHQKIAFCITSPKNVHPMKLGGKVYNYPTTTLAANGRPYKTLSFLHSVGGYGMEKKLITGRAEVLVASI